MGVNDWVWGHTLGNIPKAYVGGPYRANSPELVLANIARARQVSIWAWSLGYYVFCPHLNSGTLELDGVSESHLMIGSLKFLELCDVLILVPGWERSAGTVEECKVHVSKFKPIILYPSPELFFRIKIDDQ